MVGENITDAQVSATFGEGTLLKGLSLLAQASNLTNEALPPHLRRRHQGPSVRVSNGGRTYPLGATYKF